MGVMYGFACHEIRTLVKTNTTKSYNFYKSNRITFITTLFSIFTLWIVLQNSKKLQFSQLLSIKVKQFNSKQ
jgi:hypothetical protein